MIFLILMVHFGIFEFGDARTVGEMRRDDGVLRVDSVAMQMVGSTSQKGYLSC